jgi:hypothetical protein
LQIARDLDNGSFTSLAPARTLGYLDDDSVFMPEFFAMKGDAWRVRDRCHGIRQDLRHVVIQKDCSRVSGIFARYGLV